MNSVVEIHDSTLAGITYAGRDLVLSLMPAYVHRSAGRPGVDRGSGWLQDLDLIVSEAVVESLPSEPPGNLWGGSISIDETRWDGLMPMPLAASGAVTLTAETIRGELLVVRGAGVSIVTRGELRYVEEFSGSVDA